MTHSLSLPLLDDQGSRSTQPGNGADADRAGFGTLSTAKGNLPLRALDVVARIDGLEARLSVRQTFANSSGEPLEATYLFPLPDRAAVSSFRMEVAGRVIEGVLKERAQSRREYEKAIKAGHRAAIAEEDRSGVFSMRVGNLLPNEEAVVSLTLIAPLPYQEGEATFRFPLVVAPRYVPGLPLEGPPVGGGVSPDTDAAPDASRISPPVLLPGFPNPVRLSLAVEVQPSELDLTGFRSSLHSVLEEEEGGVRRIRLQPGERLNRDFILRFSVGGESVKTSLLLRGDPESDGTEGSFLLTLLPPTGGAPAARPRDVVFLLDRSGSMSGWKIVAARRAVARMVDSLTPADRFSLLVFESGLEEVPGLEGLAAATDRNRFRTVEYLGSLQAEGGTEMALPLKKAVQMLSDTGRERERVLVLITDGQVANEDQILKEIGAQLAAIRVFTLGIDQAVNAGFLARLAALGGGTGELVESEERLDAVMDRIHRSIGAPILFGIGLEPQQMQIDSLAPERLPDLFAGAPVFIRGRYRGSPGAISIRAVDGSGNPWSATVNGSTTGNEAVTFLWARASVRELEDRYAIRSAKALSKRIVETSLRFGVLSRFTAFVAVDRAEVANPGGRVHRIVQPVEAPEGWEMPMATRQGLMAAGFQSFYGRVGEDPEDEAPVVRHHRSGGIFMQGPRGTPPPSAKEEALDLDGCRRLLEPSVLLLLQLPAKLLGSRRRFLQQILDDLRKVLVGLRSIHAPEAEVKPLDELVKELEAFLARDRAKKEELERIWALTVERLRLFTGVVPGSGPDPAEATGARRKKFWK